MNCLGWERASEHDEWRHDPWHVYDGGWKDKTLTVSLIPSAEEVMEHTQRRAFASSGVCQQLQHGGGLPPATVPL